MGALTIHARIVLHRVAVIVLASRLNSPGERKSFVMQTNGARNLVGVAVPSQRTNELVV